MRGGVERDRAYRDPRSWFRIPVRDYSIAIREPGLLERILGLSQRTWFRRKAQSITTDQLVFQAIELRSHLDSKFLQLTENLASLEGFERKRRIPKLRYCASRLVYLAEEDRLRYLAKLAAEIPELFFHSRVMLSVANQDIDQVITLGPNAAMTAAQPLKAAGATVSTKHHDFQTAKEQSLAVFLMNGLKVERVLPRHECDSELIRFAENGTDSAMMRSSDVFHREISCLHGLATQPRHSDMLDLALDEDESIAMDAVEQLQESVSR